MSAVLIAHQIDLIL